MTSLFPITTEFQIKYKDVEVSSDLYYLQSAAAGIYTSFTTWNFTANLFDYEIEYTFGYILPSYVTARPIDLPLDIEMACIDMVKQAYNNRTRDLSVVEVDVDDMIKEKLRDPNQTAKIDGAVLTPFARDILNPYRIRRT